MPLASTTTLLRFPASLWQDDGFGVRGSTWSQVLGLSHSLDLVRGTDLSKVTGCLAFLPLRYCRVVT